MRLRFWRLMLVVTYWLQERAWSLYSWACDGERDALRRLETPCAE